MSGSAAARADGPAPRSIYLDCAGHQIHLTEWGDPGADPVIAWHGLARTGRDFDVMARALSGRYRVICPDTPGRGLSQWSADPDREYCLAHYARIAVALVERLGLDRMHWIGTSMGGAIGTVCAAGPLAGRLRGLLLNDNGPSLAAPAITRIRQYAGVVSAFATVTEFEAYLRTIYQPFGALTDAQWRHMAETSLRRLPDGRIAAHYDPAITRQFIVHPDDYSLWDAYDRLTCPVLCLRGADSDLLLAETVGQMARRGPRAKIITIDGCGHAPALMDDAQISLVRAFLDETR